VDVLGLRDRPEDRITDEAIREHLMALARDGSKRGWWDKYGKIIPPAYANYLGLEADANYIRTFQSMLIPGLLQTEAYSRAVIRANPALVRDEVIDTLQRCGSSAKPSSGRPLQRQYQRMCRDSRTARRRRAVRDSKHPAGGFPRFAAGEWNAFILGVKAREFDQ
jgi:hypothetical protein